MFARVTWSKAADKAQIDAAIGVVRDRIVPSLKTQTGFLGAVMLSNADRTEGLSSSYWQSAADMAASEEMGSAGRAEAAQASGASITNVDRFEVLLQDRVAPAIAGSFVRINDVRAAPAQIDATVAFVRDALPKIRVLSGYRAALVFANRESGRMILASSWNSAAEREASNSTISELRSQLADISQAKDVRVTLYEGVFADVSAAGQAAATPQSVS